MATRRINAPEQTVLEKDEIQDEKSNTSPAVPRHVIVKLLGFTFAMIVIPIGSYFLTVHTVFKGNSSWAGGFAALLANVVLLTYVIVAINEDDSDAAQAKSKKNE
ncbi:hypothetical protein NQ176_g3237 [Zarea fungicola]|uniref:Uncharacterized protein n=1 Tax=Zarea fungicola TaxID=93591 RepID=A0ACC1NKY6_9HYPO|nr:hypothetical protein NQ176_g3237 [Lecanicillium fungicola]